MSENLRREQQLVNIKKTLQEIHEINCDSCIKLFENKDKLADLQHACQTLVQKSKKYQTESKCVNKPGWRQICTKSYEVIVGLVKKLFSSLINNKIIYFIYQQLIYWDCELNLY